MSVERLSRQSEEAQVSMRCARATLRVWIKLTKLSFQQYPFKIEFLSRTERNSNMNLQSELPLVVQEGQQTFLFSLIKF